MDGAPVSGYREFGRPCVVTTRLSMPGEFERLAALSVENFEQTRARYFPEWQGPPNVVSEKVDWCSVVGWRDDIPEEACR